MRAYSLSRISFAALLVKVIANTEYGLTPLSTRFAILSVSTLVFPLPAPASTSTGPSKQFAAACCCAFNFNAILFSVLISFVAQSYVDLFGKIRLADIFVIMHQGAAIEEIGRHIKYNEAQTQRKYYVI